MSVKVRPSTVASRSGRSSKDTDDSVGSVSVRVRRRDGRLGFAISTHPIAESWTARSGRTLRPTLHRLRQVNPGLVRNVLQPIPIDRDMIDIMIFLGRF